MKHLLLSIISRFYSLSKSSSYPNRIVHQFPVQQGVRFAEFLVRSVKDKQFTKVSKLRALKHFYGSVPVLIIASGPSSGNLNFERVAKMQREGRLKIIALNAFIGSKMEKKAKFDAYVLSDPMYKPKNYNYAQPNLNKSIPEEQRIERVWSVLSGSECLIFTPSTWDISEQIKVRDRHFGFDDRSLEGISRNISPLRPRSYKSLTLLKALSIALFVTRGNIFIAGADQSTFLGVRVDNKNELFRGPFHFPGASVSVEENSVQLLYPRGMMDLFFDEAHTAFQLRSRFGKTGRIYNLNTSSFIDCFPKNDPLCLLK